MSRVDQNEEESSAEGHDSNTDDIDPGMRFVRNRFSYQNMEFGHDYYEMSDFVAVNRQKFGHKKYAHLTQNSGKFGSVREQLRDRPKLHPNLSDRKKPANGCLSWFKTIAYALFTIISIGTFLIQKLYPEGNLKKITSPEELVHDKVSSLASLLGRSDNVLLVLLHSIHDVGQLLNESSLMELTLAEIEKEGVVPKMWKLIGRESSECESPAKQQLLALAIYLLHDIAAVGGDRAIHRNYALKMFRNCIDVEELNHGIFGVFMMATQTPQGLGSLRGIAKPVTTALKREDFGPWDLPAMKFFAMWSQMTHLGKEDEEGICEFLDFAVKHRDSWKKEFNAMVCLVSQNLKCPAFEALDLESLYRRDECREIFAQFPKGGSEEDL